MNASETLKKIIAALDQARIPYMLTGSFASAHHGTPRSTLDLVVIAKLEWSRMAQSQRQIEDVTSILKLRWNVLDKTYLDKWIRELQLETEWNNALRASGF